MSEKNVLIQKIWGFLLLAVGLAMFFTIPSKVKAIQEAGNYSSLQAVFFQISFYIISIILTMGGGRKLYTNFRLTEETDDDKSK